MKESLVISIYTVNNITSLVSKAILILLISIQPLTTSAQEISSHTTLPAIQFTQAELEWIKTNPIVYYSDDVSWQPFVYLNKRKELEGISPEFLAHIQKLTGINFQFVYSEKFSDVIERIKKREIHLALATIQSTERDKFADFSQPYFTSKLAIVTNKSYSYIQQVSELYGKTVTAPKSYYTVDYLKENHPEIKIKLVEDVDAAFEAVFRGEADAFLGTMAVSIYRLRNSQYKSLKISGSIDIVSDVRFMVAKGNHELVSILNKALNTISPSDQRTILNNWFGVQIEQGIDPSVIWKIVLIFGSIIALSLLWISQLKREVNLRKAAEVNLIVARKEADKANAAKSEFLANMSHEIRTPMNAVFGFSELLSSTKLNQEQRQYLEAIQGGSSGLLHIINDVLEISKIEAGKVIIDFIPTDLTKLLYDIERLFLPSMKDKNLHFKLEINPKCPKAIITDPNRLRQILINLIGNALKFTAKGFVHLKVSPLDLEPLNYLSIRFDVIDSGIGVEEERQEQIFDHFIQDSNSTDNKLGGSGLGLSISRKLAEKMNGEISITSQLNKGSCFSLTLNQVEVSKMPIQTMVEIEDYKFPSATILIVDDVETNRIILKKFIEAYNFTVIIAENGEQAIELSKQHSPELILMDIRMPNMDGYTAAERIRQLINTKIIAVTASALEDTQSMNQKEVFDDFLRKPILRKKLLASIHKLL